MEKSLTASRLPTDAQPYTHKPDFKRGIYRGCFPEKGEISGKKGEISGKKGEIYRQKGEMKTHISRNCVVCLRFHPFHPFFTPFSVFAVKMGKM